MSWLFSQALVEVCSVDISLDGAQCVLWNTTPTQQASWLPARMTVACQLARSGMTYVRLTDDLGADVLTSFLAAFPAKTSVQQAMAKGLPVQSQDSGESSLVSSAKSGRRSSSSKTVHYSGHVDSKPSSQTLQPWGTMRTGVCSAQTAWVRPTSANARGSWPTRDGKPWPTPVASEGKDCGSLWTNLARLDKGGRIQRRIASIGGIETQLSDRANLNPSWVEWLNAWPIGWTDLSASATVKYQQWRHSHGENLQND